jgi:hypothetical protein
VELLKKTWELLGHLPMPSADAGFAERTITEIRQLELRSPAWEASVRSLSSWAVHAAIYVVLAILGLGAGYVATGWLWPDPSARLARDLSLAEHLEEYLEVGSFDFLDELVDAPEFSTATR